MSKVRNVQFDNIRAILIFLVVMGHVLAWLGTSHDARILYNIIFSFHMPAFLFVSGYFAKFNPKKTLATLIPLYIVFQLIQIFERFAIIWIEDGQAPGLSIDIFTPQWTLWYLLALMFMQLLIPVFDTDNRKRQIAFICVTLALGFLIGFTPDTNNFLAISRVFVFLPFFLLGYYEKKNGILLSIGRDSFKALSRILSAAAGVALVIFFCLVGTGLHSSYLYGRDAYVNGASILWRLIGWGCAFLWIVILLIWVPRRPLGYVGTIGKNTLGIYLLHPLIILILSQTPLRGWIGQHLLLLVIFSALITLALSWNGFERTIRRIRIPIKNL
ncbi:MAG: acyltransferase family protein [Lachnospiraceae bacterium]|nr:acyltransferase family protein [Lachnospiraceae bacterium]